ncbi:MAG: GTPase HflX [Oscillospiraceae bacterium]|jgi:GTP-binding protein HflX|nr:GTPase HflX [Oscillospiraceae bacterium]
MKPEHTSEGAFRAVLIGLSTRDGAHHSDEATLDELEALLETAGGTALGRVSQTLDAPSARTFIGTGKAREIRELCRNMGADIAVVDNELSPSQTKNLEAELDLPVIDRSLLIINIFSGRARSGEGRVQVELARLKYILPRLSGKGVQLSRQGGGGAGGGGARRGAGETKLETDRRHIRARIERLERELAEVRMTRKVQRERRIKNAVPSVALIGYTNAGKSTLLNTLCRDSIQAENRLFDTLDTTTRRWRMSDGREVLLTDTVGFIRKLPHHLIEAFKATLEELGFADVLLHVIDASHPEWPSQAKTVEELVNQLGVSGTPCVRALNKCDALAPSALPDIGGLAVSAKTGAGLALLEKAVAAYL